MARVMPISDLRSAANITKMRKINSNPEAIPNRPVTTKIVVKALAASSAWSRPSRLVSSTVNSETSANWVSSLRRTASVFQSA